MRPRRIPRADRSQCIAALLSGGDRRSLGKVPQVVQLVGGSAERFGELFQCLCTDDPVMRMRAADAIEKVTAQHPGLLRRYKTQLLEQVAIVPQQEVQWHVAQVIPRLDLGRRDVQKANDVLERYLRTSRSNIVCVMALQAMADLALQGWRDVAGVRRRIAEYAEAVGTPSVRARTRKLIEIHDRRARSG